VTTIANPHDGASLLRLRRALQQAPLFADLDAMSITAVERELARLVLPGGAPLFRQGEAADAVYLVASGCLGVFRHEDEDIDEPVLIAEITPGNIVGEMSLLSEGERTRSVAALRDSEVWRLSRSKFDSLTERHPEVLPTLMRYVAARNALTTPMWVTPPTANLCHSARRARRAVGTVRGTAGRCARPDRQPGPDTGSGLARRRAGMVRAL
jgi:NTE family protein